MKNRTNYAERINDALTMNSILFMPVVNTEKDFSDLISRVAWFLSFSPIARITIPVGSNKLKKLKWTVANGMDDSIGNRFQDIQDKVDLVLASSDSDIEQCVADADIILKWDIRKIPAFITTEKLKTWEAGKKVWCVDPQNTRMEGSFYIEVGLYLLKDKKALLLEHRKKFEALITKLGRYKRAYVMATGPSVWRYPLYDYQDAISIVCNSVILDDKLMAWVRPKIVVFADPIFHFGPSQYAAMFRQRLREAGRIYDFTIVIPFKYYGIFASTVPELLDRTIAVPFVKDRPFNFNLFESFEVKTTANILTLLLIPLGTTFAQEVGMLGCDGRPLDKDNYFWDHNKETQFNNKMENIRKVHPAFFAIDYNDYYLEHCQTLESQIIEGESIGKQFVSLGFSHIPALKARIDLGPRASEDKTFSVQKAIIIDPDAKSWAGHYMAYNEKLSTQLRDDGLDVEVLCRKDLAPDILSVRPNYIPILSAHSWAVGNRTENQELVDAFESEIMTAVERCLLNCYRPALLYMYCGSLEHCEVLEKLVQKHPKLRINVNLFWLSFRLTPEYAEKWKSLIKRLDEIAGHGRFVATLPTQELRDRLAELTGCILPVAPHPSTGVSDSMFKTLSLNKNKEVGSRALNVLFPSAPRLEKGYLTSIETVQRLCRDPERFHPIIRHVPTFSTPKGLVQPPSVDTGAEVIEGELGDDEFLSLFSKCDIVVLPYTPDAFAERTSGLLIDAIYFGLPSVVVRGTWLGNLTERFGNGVVVDELSADSLVSGVEAIAANYTSYRSRAMEAGKTYYLNNSWSAFSSVLRGTIRLESKSKNADTATLIGPFSRDKGAHWDETSGIDRLFQDLLSGKTMIDVGAHHGSALAPFLNRGWRIFAFEPDNENRTKLLDRLSKHKYKDRVSLDTRCVSNQAQQGIAFFTSEQSTGISGLSPFHDTHVESQKVDTTTLTDFFVDKPLPAVDFLKIDTEGHDLFVLQGFPWERAQPAVIECEFEDTKTVPLGYTFHDLAQFLVERGYIVYVSEWHPIIRYGIRHDWRQLLRYPCELADPRGWGNLLAFLDPIDEEALVTAVKKVLKLSSSKAPSTPVKSIRSIPAPGTGTAWAMPDKCARFQVEPERFFASMALNQWRFTDAEAKQKLWIASQALAATAGRVFVGTLRLQADRAVKVDATLGRHGRSDYEGTTQRLVLTPGVAQRITLNKAFQKQHEALKLQIAVVDLPGGGSAVFTIDQLGVGESIASLCQRLGADALSLSRANRLFREGDLPAALAIYVWLSQQHPFPMYGDNALRTAKALGMSWATHVDELAWVVG